MGMYAQFNPIIPSSQDEVTSSDHAMNWDATRSVNGSATHRARTRTFQTKACGFCRVKRRKVYKVEAAYAVSSCLLIQAASIFLPTFDAPQCMMKGVVAILALGFILSAILLWISDITPEGIKRTADISPDEAIDIVRQLEAKGRREFVRGYLSALLFAGLATKQKRLIILNTNT